MIKYFHQNFKKSLAKNISNEKWISTLRDNIDSIHTHMCVCVCVCICKGFLFKIFKINVIVNTRIQSVVKVNNPEEHGDKSCEQIFPKEYKQKIMIWRSYKY